MVGALSINTKQQFNIKNGYINHAFLRKNLIEARDYQINISEQAFKQNTLVVLPTALGKTIIALLTSIKILEKYPHVKILFLAPTRPLVQQHIDTFRSLINPKIKCEMFTGNLKSVQRAELLNEATFIFSTPQIIQNDIKLGLYDLKSFGLVIFDEAHKARKKYAYTFVAKNYIDKCPSPLILAITASPGKDSERINDLVKALSIEQIVFRHDESKDVMPYIHGIDNIYCKIDLSMDILKVKMILETSHRKIVNYMIEHNIFPRKSYYSKVDYIRLIQDLKKIDILLDQHYLSSLSDERQLDLSLNFPYLEYVFLNTPKKSSLMNRDTLKSVVFSKAIIGIYLNHMLEILTTQDVRMLREYFAKLHDKIADNKNKRLIRFLNQKEIRMVEKLIRTMEDRPKMEKLKEILIDELTLNPDAKIIVFTNYRKMGQFIVDNLNLINSRIKCQRFVGQASHIDDKGLSQAEQSAMINTFKNHEFNVLVATSVAEEGLDIPNVDAVIFYDAVPSEIRLIQRRGRTGRHQIGRCYYLISNDSIDLAYHNASHKKESKMHRLLKNPIDIETISDLNRENSIPEYIPITREEIYKRYIEGKKKKQLEHLEKLKEAANKSGDEIIAGYKRLIEEQRQKDITALFSEILSSKVSKRIIRWLTQTIKVLIELGTLSSEEIEAAAINEAIDLKKINFSLEKLNESGYSLKKISELLSIENN